MRDQSDRQRRIYEKLAVTDKALESTSDAIIIADKEGVTIYINPAFVRLFGYTINELNVGGIPFALFTTPSIGEQVFKSVREDGSWKGEVDLKTKDDVTVPFLLNVDSIQDDEGRLIGFISIGTDITHHRRVRAIRQQQRYQIEAQLNIAKALTSTLDLKEVFERILDNIRHVVPSDAANIILVKEGKVQLVDRDDYSDKAQIDRLKSGEVDLNEYDDLQNMLATNAPLIIANTYLYQAEHDDMAVHTPWLNSHIGIPIRLEGEIIGFLNVDSIQPDVFTIDHVEQLQLFVEQAAIAIRNARLHERAQYLAMVEERQRLARNLHDAVSQTLFSANIIAEALPKLWHTRPDDVLPRLEQIQALNRSALAEMRSLLLELYPERLLKTEMEVLMQQLVQGVLGKLAIDVTLEMEKDLTLPSDVHVAVYYITQEALNNVVKHAQASHVTVRLHWKSRLSLTITDNGCGFDPQQVTATSLGLSNFRQRASATNADLTITSTVGKGTEISVHWPILRRSR